MKLQTFLFAKPKLTSLKYTHKQLAGYKRTLQLPQSHSKNEPKKKFNLAHLKPYNQLGCKHHNCGTTNFTHF